MGLVLLALGAAAQAAMAPTEYTYQVTASIVLPGHGFHGYDMDVRLSTMPADWHATLPGAPKAAARAVRLDVDRVRHYDDKGGAEDDLENTWVCVVEELWGYESQEFVPEDGDLEDKFFAARWFWRATDTVCKDMADRQPGVA